LAVYPQIGSELDIVLNGIEPGLGATIISLAAGGSRHPDTSENGTGCRYGDSTTNRYNPGEVAGPCMFEVRGCFGKAQGVLPETHGRPGLVDRHIDRMRPGEAVSDHHLRNPGTIRHGHGNLKTFFPASIKRGLRELQGCLRRELLDRKGRILSVSKAGKSDEAETGELCSDHMLLLEAHALIA
jgi:hypothetical protein